MMILGDWRAGPNVVQLLGDEHSGGLVVQMNDSRAHLPRGNAQLLAEGLARFLEVTKLCPKCGHGRIDHFSLFTTSGRLYGCSAGADERHALADGLPCRCSGIPE